MKLSTKIIHWSVFLLLSGTWWILLPTSIADFTVKLLIWCFFFGGRMVVTSDDDGYDCEWQ